MLDSKTKLLNYNTLSKTISIILAIVLIIKFGMPTSSRKPREENLKLFDKTSKLSLIYLQLYARQNKQIRFNA